jgi:hypothetical protein
MSAEKEESVAEYEHETSTIGPFIYLHSVLKNASSRPLSLELCVNSPDNGKSRLTSSTTEFSRIDSHPLK